MGGTITIHNETQYKWTVCIEFQEPWPKSDDYTTFTVGPYGKELKRWVVPITINRKIYIKVKYGDCSETDCYKNPHLWFRINPKDDPYFTIRESEDLQEIHLDCNIDYKKKKPTCPNYGKIEDDAREEEENHRRDEEQRRQAQLERERRIEEQIKRESELAAKKLSQATETLKQRQRLRGHEVHHQTHIMQQPLDTEVEIDEVPEIEKKFMELLLEYQITEDEDSEETLADRMKTLQNELMVEFCKKHNLSSSCVFSLNTAVGYETLPLHDRLSVLEAVMHVVFEENEEDHTQKNERDVLLDLLELLQDARLLNGLIHPMESSNVANTTLNHACNYFVQELAIQGVNTAMNTRITSVQKTFEQGFRDTFKKSICSSLHQNEQFGRALTDFISSGIPKAALEKISGSYKINRTLEKEMKDYMDLRTTYVMNDLIVNCKEIQQVINTLSQVWDKSAEFVAHHSHTCIKMLLTTTDISTTIYDMYSSIPTKQTIDNNFVPAFLKFMKEDPLFETYDNDGRDGLEDVERLKDDIIDLISDILSQTMVESFSGFTKTITQRLNSVTGKLVGNLLERHETQSLFASRQHHYDLKSATECKDRSLSEEEINEFECYANSITDEQKPATALEVHVLTKSNLLNGKGICITVVDHKGKLLTEESYKGTDPAAGNINLVMTKIPLTSPETRGMWSKLIDRVKGKDTEQSGHIDIIRPDGSRETVNSSNQNCLFHAVIQATSNDPNDVVKQKAVELRSKVSDEIREKPHKYIDAVKIQNMFNRTNSSNKFQIEAGGMNAYKKQFLDKISKITPKKIISEYKFGKVDKYERLLKKKKPTPRVVEADHIPPKSCLNEVYKLLKRHPEKANSLESNNEAAYKLVMKMEKCPNGRNQLCMNSLYWDHRRALTTGSSSESRACRRLLTKTLLSGDMEKVLKLSLISAHPGISDSIRNSEGICRKNTNQNSVLEATVTNKYYKDGFIRMVDVYSKRNLIDQNQKDRLMKWVKEERYLDTSTPEYIEIKDAVNRRNTAQGQIIKREGDVQKESFTKERENDIEKESFSKESFTKERENDIEKESFTKERENDIEKESFSKERDGDTQHGVI